MFTRTFTRVEELDEGDADGATSTGEDGEEGDHRAEDDPPEELVEEEEEGDDVVVVAAPSRVPRRPPLKKLLKKYFDHLNAEAAKSTPNYNAVYEFHCKEFLSYLLRDPRMNKSRKRPRADAAAHADAASDEDFTADGDL